MHTKMSICAPNCCSWQTAAPADEGKKGRHLRFLPSLNTRFPCWDSLGADGRLRKQEKGNDSRVTSACLSPPFRSSQIAYCYTCGLFLTGATQGELPEGQEKVPWGITVSRNSLAWIFCTTPTNCTRYTVGCDKVNCPSGQEKVLWGTTRRTACIRPAQSIP